MLSQLVPADIHQHHRIQSIPGIPRRGRGVGALSLKVNSAEMSSVLSQAVHGAELLADMIMQRHIDIFEISVADKIRPADQLLFRRGAENFSACP